MKIKNIRLLKYINIAFSIFAAVLVSTNKEALKISAASEVEKIQITDPLDDLMLDENFKDDYLKGVYRFDHKSNPSFVNFSEYKYQNSFTEDFGLYLYIFNPNDKKPIDLFSDKNTIQLSIGESNTQYVKYPLKAVKKTTGEIENMFYKFRVVTDESFHNMLDSNERVYNVSSFEIAYKNESNATDIEIGSTFCYSGYAKGCNNNEESSLLCEKKGLDYINIEIHNGYKRSGYVNENLTKAIDLHYAYFEIPNWAIEAYGQPYSVSYHFYKYQLDKGLFNIDKNDYYDENWQTLMNEKGLYAVFDPKKYDSTTIDPLNIDAWTDQILFDFRGKIGKENNFSSVSQIGNRLFREENANSEISSFEIENKIKEMGLKYFSSTTKSDAYSGILESTINDLEGPAETLIVDNPDLNFFANLANLQVWGHGPFGRTQVSGTSWSDIPAFEVVSHIDDSNGTNYTINKNDVIDFNRMFNSTSTNDTTMVILRYCETEYWSAPIQFINPGLFSSVWKDVGYICNPTIIEDFDILTLGFIVDKVITVIPVVASPTTTIVDGTAPVDDRPETLDWWDKIISGKNTLNIKLIIGIICGIVLIFIVIKLIMIITDHRAKKSQIKANNIEVKKYKEEKKEHKNEK